MHCLQARRRAEQQAPKVTTNYPQDGTLSPSRLSSRSGGGSLPTASDKSLGHSPSGKGGHTGRGQPSSKQASSPERQEQAGTQRHPDGQSKALPERHSAHRDTPEQGAQLASPRHRRGRRGGPRSSPRGRAVARRHSRSQRQSPSQHTSPVERAPKQARLDSTPSQNQAASAQASPSPFNVLLLPSDRGPIDICHGRMSRHCTMALQHSKALHHGTASRHCIRALHHGNAPWHCTMPLHRGTTSWLCIMARHQGTASWLCTMALHHGIV